MNNVMLSLLLLASAVVGDNVSTCYSPDDCDSDGDCCGNEVCSEGICMQVLEWWIIVLIIVGVLSVVGGVNFVIFCCTCCDRDSSRDTDGQNEPYYDPEMTYAENPALPRTLSALPEVGYPECAGLSAPPAMTCPISLQLMKDPVYCVNRAHVFERKCLEEALKLRKECPLSRIPMVEADITPNDELRMEIEEHVRLHKEKEKADEIEMV